MIPYLSAFYDNALCRDGGMTQIIRSRAEEGLPCIRAQPAAMLYADQLTAPRKRRNRVLKKEISNITARRKGCPIQPVL